MYKYTKKELEGETLFSVESQLHGIPCIIAVTDYYVGRNNWDDPSEVSYVITDRKGYPARWLAKKVTLSDEYRIFTEIDTQYQREVEYIYD